MKTILKILYVVFCGVIALILYFGMQSSFVSQNYVNLLHEASNTAATEKNYDDIARCFSLFSTPIDKQKVCQAQQGDENVTVVYSSVNNFTSTYLVDGKSTTVTRIEDVYLFIIYNPTFQFENSSDGTNKSALRFEGKTEAGDDVHYDYNFTVSSEVNKDQYKANPTTEKSGALNCERKHISEYRDFNLIFVPVPVSLMNYIKSEKKMTTVTGFNIIENTGAKVYNPENYTYPEGGLKLDYSQQFFTDLSTWVEKVNIYTRYSNGENFEQEIVDDATTYVNNFTENPNQYVANFDDLYFRGIAHGDVFTGASVVLKALGVVALFLVVAIILYIVLFRFAWIKAFVKRFSKKAEPERNIPNRAPRTQTVISKSSVRKTEEKVIDVEPEKPVVEEVKEETPVEETKEEVNAEVEVEEAETKESTDEESTEN